MRTVAVVAGNLGEFQYFINEKLIEAKVYTVYQRKAIIGNFRYIYISRDRDLHGLVIDEIVYYGTFDNKPYSEIEYIRRVAMSRLRTGGSSAD